MTPSVGRRVHDPVDHCGEPRRDEHGAGDIELGGRIVVTHLLEIEAAMMPAVRPSGTLMKKIQRHDTQPVRIPPSSPPTAPPAPATALHAPMALGSRDPWNVVTMMVSVAERGSRRRCPGSRGS